MRRVAKSLTLVSVGLLVLLAAGTGSAVGREEPPEKLRFATFNASLNRNSEGQLIQDLSTPGNDQADTVAEIIQRTRPDILLINEFDFDDKGPGGTSLAAKLFQDNYLSIAHGDARPIIYGYRFVAPSNTGIPSGFDFNNDNRIGGPDDAFGFGFFPRSVRHGRLLAVPHRHREDSDVPDVPVEEHARRAPPR